ncbi:hypothetical protein N7530_001512 [Penicillium desertorum]|uniref:Mitochondrial F1F0 ATP synthase subunit Atp14 n=1 Tax=Penicillium desertorum TaxID=1303715 RepID=A0A9W9XA88_9EURO|nr:hypothetical protein N7530_001512 [Penicillium desertorum]
MMSQSLRASRTLFSRASRAQVSVARRTFLTSAVRQADPAGDAEEHVQKFTAPKPPQSPEEANLASDLSAYESQEVEVEGQAAAGEAAPTEESWFEEEEEAPAAH